MTSDFFQCKRIENTVATKTFCSPYLLLAISTTQLNLIIKISNQNFIFFLFKHKAQKQFPREYKLDMIFCLNKAADTNRHSAIPFTFI